MIWTEYIPEGDSYIPVGIWGKDHWSTFAYAASCVAGNGGKIDNRRMRTNPRIHRDLAGITNGTIMDGGKFPTLIKERSLPDHDDWSCIEDAVAAGLLRVFFRKKNQGIFGGSEAKVELTELGWEIEKRLVSHKNSGKRFSDFQA